MTRLIVFSAESCFKSVIVIGRLFEQVYAVSKSNEFCLRLGMKVEMSLFRSNEFCLRLERKVEMN